jgi:uncharacterized protein (TIGR02448 family)
MTRSLLLCALLACSISPALAGSFAGTSAGASSAGSSASSGSTSGNDKVVVQARDDAASFVASDGRIRGAQLEAALRHLREHDATAQRASDMDLAKAILAL